MNVEISGYIIRLTRLETAKLLVDPHAQKEFYDHLRARLGPAELPGDVVDGTAVVRALPAGAGNGSSPRVKNVMAKLSKGLRRQKCRYCKKGFKSAAWLARHLAAIHPAAVENGVAA